MENFISPIELQTSIKIAEEANNVFSIRHISKKRKPLHATTIALLKSGSLHETILRILYEKCSVADQLNIFDSPFCTLLSVSMAYEDLSKAVAMDDEYLRRLDLMLYQAAAGCPIANAKIKRSHEERMIEAVYLFNQKSRRNKNSIRLERMGLVFRVFKLKGHKFVSLLRKDKEEEFNLQVNLW